MPHKLSQGQAMFERNTWYGECLKSAHVTNGYQQQSKNKTT